MATTNGLSTPLSLMKFMHLTKTIPNKDTTTKEEVGTGDGSQLIFWLDHLGVIENTYTLYYGASESSVTALTETTHYTINLDTSEITLTTAGRTAIGINKIYAKYTYNYEELLNSEILKELNAAENKVLQMTEQVFANYTDTNPAYKKVVNEKIEGHFNPYNKVFELYYVPMVNFETTVDGDYTTGATSIVLTAVEGLPETGTIYIDGNKVSYTAKDSVTKALTIPATTPSIDDGALVRGEVIEISTQPEGSSPSYTVLTPDTDYKIDYDQSYIKPLSNAYFGEVGNYDRIYPTNNLIRATYFHAWHEPNTNPTVPDNIEWAVNVLAARKLMGSIVAKAHTTGLNDFNPSLINVDMEEVKETLMEYKPLNVGKSSYNKQRLT